MEPFVGQIMPVGFNFAPRGYAFCQGQVVPIQQNAALYSLLGTTYGGNGQTTFALPDLRGRAAIGFGQGPGLPNYTIGQPGGVTSVSLTIANLPPHTHTAVFTPAASATTATGTLTAINASGTERATAGANLANPATNTSQLNAYVPATPTGAVQIAGVSVSLPPPAGGTVVNSSTGQGQPINTASPYLTINYIIATDGIYPSRN